MANLRHERPLIRALRSIPLVLLASACSRDRGTTHDAPTGAPSGPLANLDAGGPHCAALTKLAIPHVTIAQAKVVTSDPKATRHFASYCRVDGIAHPTTDSEIHFEVAIPRGDAWNGRYLQVGNGAFAGRIPEGDLLDALAYGYAVAATDDGHEAAPADARWALGHPEKLVDFGYRAVKETHDAARAIVQAATGIAPKYSYFTGCSDGGREALMEAQRYPDDFDGIVAGAPTIATTHVLFDFAWNVRALSESPASYISRAKLPAIEAAAIRACGEANGVIEHPLACHFDPNVLLCRKVEDDACLTAAQIKTLEAIYGGLKDPKSGERILYGFEPGGEAEPKGPEPDGFSFWIIGEAPGANGHSGDFQLSDNFFRYMAFEDPNYDLARLNFSEDVGPVDRKLASILNPNDPDLGAFKRRGGKFIHYHGWIDAVLPPRESIAYFDRVHTKMGDTSDFYRLFMAPGMAHCEGGNGPNVLATIPAISGWVERGVAPERIVATKYVGDSAANAISRTSAICPYPQEPTWDGKGDRAKQESYRCTPPPAR